ncbi:MAG: hypothetical protein GY765_15450 [bacterium]|nr:hypothetical protein [bacterium]
MNSILPESFFNQPTATENQSNSLKSAQQLKVNASRKENQDVTLTTDEGDRVTISLNSSLKAEYMAFDYTSMLNGKSESMEYEKMGFSKTNSFSINVEGDLNEEEKEDIQNVLAKLDGVMKNLVDGNIEEILQNAPGLLNETDTISSLEAILQFQQSVSVEQSSFTQMSGEGLQGMQGNPFRGKGVGEGHPGKSIIAKISGQLMDIIDESKVEPKNLVDPVDKLFKELSAELLKEKDEDKTTLAGLFNLIGSEVIDELQNLIPAETTDPEAIDPEVIEA